VLTGRDNRDTIRLEALHEERVGARMPALHCCEIKALVFAMVINSSISQRMMLQHQMWTAVHTEAGVSLTVRRIQ